MIKFYFNPSPNPMKVALLLEELGLPYEPMPVDPRRGEQFAPEYLTLNPNAKVPAIVDGETTVFDSNAIVLYLAEKTGRFLPEPSRRGEMLSWLMFVASGIGPYSGQAVHFRHHAPGLQEYTVNRYDFEVERHYRIVDQRLGKQPYMLGSKYSIVDMALWGWARLIPHVLGSQDAWDNFPNVRRLHDEINARPAAVAVERLRGQYGFKTEWDEEARRNMFPQLARLGMK
ncbi:MAG: glutathione S-transferase family protein [Burkholderiales bacterium]|nr:glutathione S-transferase family protein [Burkholderiales bacterium]